MKEDSPSKFDIEEKLVEALQRGEEKAFAFLMDRYYKALCRYAFSLCKEHSRAEDIVQNVMLRIWTTRHRLRVDSSIKGLLYRAVYNGFLDQYKHNKLVSALEKSYAEALNTIIEEEEEDLERLMALVQLEIGKLSPKCREIFLLSKKEGLTNMEIAEYLKVSIKTVEAQMSRAFKQLRKKVGEQMESILFLLFGQACECVH